MSQTFSLNQSGLDATQLITDTLPLYKVLKCHCRQRATLLDRNTPNHILSLIVPITSSFTARCCYYKNQMSKTAKMWAVNIFTYNFKKLRLICFIKLVKKYQTTVKTNAENVCLNNTEWPDNWYCVFTLLYKRWHGQTESSFVSLGMVLSFSVKQEIAVCFLK